MHIRVYMVTGGSTLGHVSKIVSILLSKLSDCPNTDTSLCYYLNDFRYVANQAMHCRAVGIFQLPYKLTSNALYCRLSRGVADVQNTGTMYVQGFE